MAVPLAKGQSTRTTPWAMDKVGMRAKWWEILRQKLKWASEHGWNQSILWIYFISISATSPCMVVPGTTPCMVFQLPTELFIRIPSEINPLSAYSSCSRTETTEWRCQSPIISFPKWKQTLAFIDFFILKKRIHNSTTKRLAYQDLFFFP